MNRTTAINTSGDKQIKCIVLMGAKVDTLSEFPFGFRYVH
jgi:hypothetical protein